MNLIEGEKLKHADPSKERTEKHFTVDFSHGVTVTLAHVKFSQDRRTPEFLTRSRKLEKLRGNKGDDY